MSGPRIGALFAGYGGLDLAVRDVIPTARLAWVSEFDAAPSRILAQRFPDAPNHGDVTRIDWHAVEPVDIITGGSPCQDLSHAGKRAGMKDGTRSGLWASMCDAIDIIRPSLVIWENVRGALSAPATAGDVESCGFCMADTGEPPLRALGRVLGDLAELGYDAAWTGLRAADVGAPHGRWRVFVLAWPRDAADTHGDLLGQLAGAAPVQEAGPHEGHGPADPGRGGRAVSLLRTPTAQLAVNGGSQHPDKRKAGGHGPTLADEVEHLLPTPAVNDMGASYDVEGWDACSLLAGVRPAHLPADQDLPPASRAVVHDLLPAARVCGVPHPEFGMDHPWRCELPAGHDDDHQATGRGPLVRSLHTWAQEVLLPTPSTAPERPQGRANNRDAGRSIDTLGGASLGEVFGVATTVEQQGGAVEPGTFGPYAPAVARWEAVIGRPAPPPTEPTGKGGAHRLSPRFVEWMMGLPEGWVTDTDTTRNEQLKALGNGVVPQQAAAAIRHLLDVRANALAVAA